VQNEPFVVADPNGQRSPLVVVRGAEGVPLDVSLLDVDVGQAREDFMNPFVDGELRRGVHSVLCISYFLKKKKNKYKG